MNRAERNRPARALLGLASALALSVMSSGLASAQAPPEPAAATGGEEDIPTGRVHDPTRQAYPLAVTEVQGDEGLASVAAEATRVLRSDLNISGFFNLIPPNTFLADPRKEGLAPATIEFQKWFDSGAQGLVKGVVQGGGGKVTLDLRLYLVERGSQVDLGLKPREVPAKRIYREVHRQVNAIIRHFTGKPGIFGSQIAYVARTGKGNKVVMAMDLDGKHTFRVSRGDTLNLLPAWSPGGGAVLYTSYANGNPDLVLQTLGSKAPLVLSKQPGLNVGGAFAPGGNVVALTLSRDGNSEIYLVSASDGSIVQRLTNNWATDTSPAWSPDGSRIAFVSDRAGSPQIYVMNADGSGAKRMTFRGNYNTTPDWSPKGDKIAFTARDERYVFDIFVIDVASGQIERLTQDAGHNEEPSFSPDGNYIAFTSTRGGMTRLFIMGADGYKQVPLTEKGGGYHTPAWGPAPSF